MPTIRRIDHWVAWGSKGGWNIDSTTPENQIARIVFWSLDRARLAYEDWKMLGYGYATEFENPVTALRIPGNQIDSVDWLDIVYNVRFILENFK